MEPNLAEIASAGATCIAAVAAIVAGHQAFQAYRASFRPILRPVPARHDYDINDIKRQSLILKNLGRGPAVSVFLVEPDPPKGERWPPTHPGPVVAKVDVVEPLGEPLSGGGEMHRIGRTVLPIPDLRALRDECTYRLLYQDVARRWHETTFRITNVNGKQELVTRYRGRLPRLDPQGVPSAVAEQAQIVLDYE